APGGDVMRGNAWRISWLACLIAVFPSIAAPATPARVYAAASLTQALTEIATLWQRAGHPAPVLVFAGSATLARQLEAGAAADVFISADSAWLDALAKSGRVDAASRTDLLGNALVLIAPQTAPFRIDLRPGAPLGQAFEGRLCTGEPGVVPVGTYARAALQWLGAWDSLTTRLVGTEDVRAALALVERGHCGAGIVYATDARGSTRVVAVGTFPATSHRPIVYPAALLRGATPQGRAFFEFVRDSQAAAVVFERVGFTRLGKAPR
ncbi:MAG TPA: molybdate ABC transporter substrate-binding protein, partial [Steroidobacteraceae bacterium]|nr:molybdate ABC transporter substrate-binding protein [Steroidobacteraceae bacterium]